MLGKHYQPFFKKQVRIITGCILLSAILALIGPGGISPKEFAGVCFSAFVLWGLSAFLTDKYEHKYPQRYLAYTIAATFKACMIVIFILVLLFLSGIFSNAADIKLLYAMVLILAADFLVSLPKREEKSPDIKNQVDLFLKNNKGPTSAETKEIITPLGINHATLRHHLKSVLPEKILAFIQRNIPDSEDAEQAEGVITAADLPQLAESTRLLPAASTTLVIGQVDLNSVKRLNTFLKEISISLRHGGYCVVHYKPLEDELERIRQESSSFTYPFKYLRHFIWFRVLPKTRLLSKIYFSPPFSWIDTLRGGGQRRSMARAETWGRLFFHGMQVIDETMDGEYAHVIAQKISSPSTDTIPTYHSIVALNKMGLNGQTIRLHKIRSMYPFSEFLQKHIYQMHGLTNTGKFKNDFRLTEYGPFIRKYWIDEIPGIYDWLRGDVKLVGMRATSPHYLSLYPKEIIEMYFQVKPGLVPPIFDEKTTGFDQIVDIEKKYLESYIQNPARTDILYFWYTFRDIFIRKVRSK